MRSIKKYSNRRLYDTVDSRYVNLEELAALVRAGHDLEIVDATTGADLTRGVLLQILLEVQDGERLFPPGLLHRIIRYGGDHPLQRAALQQVGAGLELLDAQMRQMERQLSWMRPSSPPPAPPPASAAPAAASSAAASSAAASSAAASSADTPPEAGSAAASGPPSGDAELDALRARLASLEARLERG